MSCRLLKLRHTLKTNHYQVSNFILKENSTGFFKNLELTPVWIVQH